MRWKSSSKGRKAIKITVSGLLILSVLAAAILIEFIRQENLGQFSLPPNLNQSRSMFDAPFISDKFEVIGTEKMDKISLPASYIQTTDYLIIDGEEHTIDRETISNILVRKETSKQGDITKVIYGFKNLGPARSIQFAWKNMIDSRYDRINEFPLSNDFSASVPVIDLYSGNAKKYYLTFSDIVSAFGGVEISYDSGTRMLMVLSSIKYLKSGEELVLDPGGGDVAAPAIDFISPTPSNGSSQGSDFIYVNVSSSDTSDHYAFVDFDRSLILWMTFDAVNSTGDPTDLSSYQNNGSRVGNAAQNISGIYNTSFSFKGKNEYINISDNPTTSLTGNFTLVAWINSRKSGAKQGIIGKNDAGVIRGYELSKLATNNLVFLTADGSSSTLTNGNLALNNDTWYHVAAVFNGTNSSIWLNGKSDKSQANTIYPTDGTGPLKIGGIGPQETNTFNGSIDEVLIFNRSLSPAEISALYNATANQYMNNFTNLSSIRHNFTAYAVDTSANRNNTGMWQVTVTYDTAFPLVTIQFPPSGNTSSSTINFNATVLENNPGSGLLSVNASGQSPLNYTLTNRSGNWGYTNLSMPDNVYTARFFINDSSGNMNSTESVAFTINTTTEAPQISGIVVYNSSIIQPPFFRPLDTVVIKVNITDREGRDDISSVFLNISDPNSVLKASGSMSRVAQVSNGYTYQYNYTIPDQLSGNWMVSIVAYDYSSNKGTNSGTFRVSIQVPEIHYLQVSLSLNNTGSLVYIPGTGEVPSSSLPTSSFQPLEYYLASYQNSNLKALVFSRETPISVSVRQNATHHFLALNQTISNSLVFLAFTRGNYQAIERRMPLIRDGSFLTYPLPTFAFSLGGEPSIKIAIDYNDLDIQSNVSAEGQEINVVVEDIGQANNREVIRIRPVQ